MRVILNAVAVKGGGGRTYLVNILDALVAASAHEFQVVLTSRQGDLAAALPDGVRCRVCRGVPASPWLRIAWEQTVLPLLLRRWRADLVFAAFNTAPLLAPAPIVLVQQTVNPYSDLPIRWPLAMRARHAALRWLGRLSSRVARRVVFVSETSAACMAPQLGVPAGRMRVIHYGWRAPAPVADAARHSAPADRYILTVGDLLEHKNVETLLDAFERFVADTRYPGRLVVAGRAQNGAAGYGARLRRHAGRLHCRNRVDFTGHVPQGDLWRLYAGADLFVLPSLEETFGLPLVEAMGAGTPVVVADWRLHRLAGDRTRANVGPEICGAAAEFFDPLDAASLSDAMRRVLEDPVRRAEMARLGREQAARFSWTRAAAETLEVFQEATTTSR